MAYASAERYREMDVLAMSPGRRLVMLYAHLLLALRQARGHAERGEIEDRTERLLHAEAIVRELAVSLDHTQGDDLAGRLAQLYHWMLGQLASLHRTPELERIDTLTRIVSELHEAWTTVAGQAGATGPP